MRSRISIRGYVRPSVRPSVGRSVRPSVGHTRVEFLIYRLKWNKIALRTWYQGHLEDIKAKIEQKSRITRNYHLRDHLKTSTRADRQDASYVCTPSDLFFNKHRPSYFARNNKLRHTNHLSGNRCWWNLTPYKLNLDHPFHFYLNC